MISEALRRHKYYLVRVLAKDDTATPASEQAFIVNDGGKRWYLLKQNSVDSEKPFWLNMDSLNKSTKAMPITDKEVEEIIQSRDSNIFVFAVRRNLW